jgi:hypothetical protein
VAGSVLLIGLGDLGRRIAERLSAAGVVEQLVLAGRNAGRGSSVAALLEPCGECFVTFAELSALDQSACERLLRAHRPALVVQSACFVSPWKVAAALAAPARGGAGFGFAVQLPFQILCVRTVMMAVREVGYAGPVVNCSYPDATNAMLAAEGLAPTVGIGNVGMMQARVEAALRREGSRAPLVRLVAHHSQTASVVTQRPLDPGLGPWVFVGEEGVRRDELAYQGDPIAWGMDINSLSAAVAVRVIHALLPQGSPVRTSAPGPLGLPGGYPVRLAHQSVELDLPPGISREDAVRENLRAGRLDGLAELRDGVATWTPELAAQLESLDPELAAPLQARDAMARARRLVAALELDPHLPEDQRS